MLQDPNLVNRDAAIAVVLDAALAACQDIAAGDLARVQRAALAAIARTDEREAERKQYAAQIEAAREQYAKPSNDDLEIDEKPNLSVADGGVWVSAWVWVSTEEGE